MPATNERRFRLYTDEEIERLPAPQWCIEQVVPANCLGVIFGPYASKKTFLALGMAAHVSLGLDWCGHRVRRGLVVYVYAEGRGGLGRRLAALKAFHGTDKLGILFLPQRMVVNEVRDCEQLISAIHEKVGQRNEIAVIFIDTLNRNSTGDENDTKDMSEFVLGCDVLRERTGAAVLVVHHPGRTNSNRGRGSSVLDGAADTIISVKLSGKGIAVECQKQKDAAEFEALHFESVAMAGSLVLRPSDAPASGPFGQRLTVLSSLHQGAPDLGLRYKAWLLASGIQNPSSFDKARDWLKKNGYVHSSGGYWQPTDLGLRALGPIDSTNSTSTPHVSGGVSPIPLHQTEGLCNSPPVE